MFGRRGVTLDRLVGPTHPRSCPRHPDFIPLGLKAPRAFASLSCYGHDVDHKPRFGDPRAGAKTVTPTDGDTADHIEPIQGNGRGPSPSCVFLTTFIPDPRR